jgi:hypothetical protein
MQVKLFCPVVITGVISVLLTLTGCKEKITEIYYIGTAPSDFELKVTSSEVIKKAVKPKGAWGEVPTWLNVDLLSDSSNQVLYSGKVEGTAYSKGLHNQISAKISIVPATKHTFIQALTRVTSSLKQANSNSKLWAVIVTKGVSKSTETASIHQLVADMAKNQGHLAGLCILGVDSDKQLSTASFFKPIRGKVVVVSTLSVEQNQCLSH